MRASSPDSAAVGDAAAFFPGLWSLRRRIVDRRAGMVGAMRGEAAITPDDDGGFAMTEAGALRFGAHRGPARRLYRIIAGVDGDGALEDENGVTLARFDFAAPRQVFRHACGDDLYRGRLAARGRDAWRIGWRITGPRKDLVITTLYSRLSTQSTNLPAAQLSLNAACSASSS